MLKIYPLFEREKLTEFLSLSLAALPKMIERKSGHIVCVGSIQGKFSLPHRSAYSASKHAMQAFCDSLRAEVAEHNISVLCVSPGYINTALSLNALTASGRAYGSKIYKSVDFYSFIYFHLFNFRSLNSLFSANSNGCKYGYRCKPRAYCR